MRLDERQQLGPRHDLLHLVKEHTLARAPAAQIHGKAGLLHARIVPVRCGSCNRGYGVLNMIPSAMGRAGFQPGMGRRL